MLLTGQVFLVTGAGGGLGGMAALTLAKQGAHIILLDHAIAKLEAVYDAITAAKAPEPIMYPFDLAGASEADYLELANKVAARYGSLQGLLHSAVEFKTFTPMAMVATSEWGHSLNVNLNGPFLLTRVLLPVLQTSQYASVVFTSDSSARQARAYAGAYGVSKIALEGYAKILADELEAGGRIRVNVLLPGPVDSPLRRRAYPAEDRSQLPAIADLAPVYRYLFGPKSLGVTGQVIDARDFLTGTQT